METIVTQLEEYNKAYRAGNPIVPNEVYDALLEELPEDHPYRNQVEPEELYKGRIKHSKPMLSMQKAKTKEDIEKWINTILDSGFKFKSKMILIKCTAKLDGIAGKKEDGTLVTRGDGQYGNDVTSSFDKGLLVLVKEINNAELGEFVIRLDYFQEKLSKDFSHPRNFVSGAIMADTVSDITNKAFEEEQVVFQSYSLLPKKVIPIIDLLKNFRELEEAISKSVNYAIDGVIFEVINPSIRRIMGETDHHPNWAIALKPKDKVYISTILEIKWQTGRTGKVTPVVIIETTLIDGVEVRRATAHNAKMVETMGLHVGAKIELIRSGSVIPYIVRVVGE